MLGSTNMLAYDSRPRSPRPRIRAPRETLHSFCQRLDHPNVIAGCELTNRWLAAIPARSHPEYLARLRATDDHNHISALFELFLFDLFARCNLQPDPPENSMPGSRPEMWLRRDGRAIASVEAMVKQDRDASTRDHSRLCKFLAEAGPFCADRDIGLWVERVVVGSDTPSARKFGCWLTEWVNARPRSLRGELGSASYEDRGWRIDVRVFRCEPNGPTDPQSPYMGGPATGGWVNGGQRLLETLHDKSRQHRDQALPVVIAVAWNDFRNESQEQFERVLQRSDQAEKRVLLCSACHPWTLSGMRAEYWKGGKRNWACSCGIFEGEVGI